MALSGSKTSAITSSVDHYLSWSAVKKPTTNSFDITVTVKIRRTDSYTSSGSAGATLYIGSSSSTVSTSYMEIGGSGGSSYKTIGSYTTNIKANSSGAASVTIKSVITNPPGDAIADGTTTSQRTLSYSISPDPIGHYKVTFDANGGSGAPAAQTKVEDIPMTISSVEPKRTGYWFSIWICDYDNGKWAEIAPGGKYSYNGSGVLSASWGANIYNVNFNGNGGQSTENPTYQLSYDETKSLRNNFYTKTGYHFSHWNTKSDGSGTSYDGGQSVKNLTTKDGATVTLYAIWTPNDYWVYVDNQGGSGGISKMAYTYGWPVPTQFEDISRLLPTKSGYRFGGYYSGTNGTGTQFYNSSGISTYSGNWSTTNDITIYAYWILDLITISFNPNGGSCSTTSKTVTPYGTYGDLPYPSWYGKLFNGWYADGTYVTSSSSLVYNSNHTLTASWYNDYAYIYFDAMGGSCSTSSKRVDYGYSYGTLPVPTRSGYRFDGWYTSTSGGSLVTSSTTNWSISSVTVYARWTSIVYTVTFDANGGACDTTTKSVTYGSAYGTLPSPTKYGHRFSGWKYGSNFITDTTTMNVYSDHTLVAVYDVIQYTISLFDKNADTPFLTQIHEHGSEISEITVPNREHYIYRGLFHDKACTNRVSLTDLITSDMTLYALFLEDGVLSIYLDGKLDNFYVYVLENGEVVRRIPKFLHNGKIY